MLHWLFCTQIPLFSSIFQLFYSNFINSTSFSSILDYFHQIIAHPLLNLHPFIGFLFSSKLFQFKSPSNHSSACNGASHRVVALLRKGLLRKQPCFSRVCFANTDLLRKSRAILRIGPASQAIYSSLFFLEALFKKRAQKQGRAINCPRVILLRNIHFCKQKGVRSSSSSVRY